MSKFTKFITDYCQKGIMSREVRVGDVKIGGDNPIIVQSMCNSDDILEQIRQLEEVGCEMVRIAVPDMETARKIRGLREQIGIPLVADIHYDYRLALEVAKYVDKIRINPGNMAKDKLIMIAKVAKAIRIGVNIGSLPKPMIDKYGHTPKAMVETALDTIELFESQGFYNMIVSLKSSDIFQTIEANRLFQERSDYPVHLGITEAGTKMNGTVRSSIGLGYLLMEGIGDTMRVSLSADPVEEVKVAYSILRALKLREGPTVISCPTCARAEIDVIDIAQQVESRLEKLKTDIKVGVMGCFVNAQEAELADIGVAGAGDHGIIFRDGKVIKRFPKEELIEGLLKEIHQGKP